MNFFCLYYKTEGVHDTTRLSMTIRKTIRASCELKYYALLTCTKSYTYLRLH